MARKLLATLLSLSLLSTAPLSSQQTTRASLGVGGAQANGGSHLPALSGDGRFVAFASGASNLVPVDTNGFEDVFVRDRQSRTITCVSLDRHGGQSNQESTYPALSADGRFVAFQSFASDLV